MPNDSLRAYWTVTAGVVPNLTETEHTRQFFYTGQEFEQDKLLPPVPTEGPDPIESIFQKKRKAAYEYASSITDPRYLNWVNIAFMWM